MIGLVSISNGQHTQQTQFPEQKPQITQIIVGGLPAIVGALFKHFSRFLLPGSVAVSMSISKAESAAWLNRERPSHLLKKEAFLTWPWAVPVCSISGMTHDSARSCRDLGP